MKPNINLYKNDKFIHLIKKWDVRENLVKETVLCPKLQNLLDEGFNYEDGTVTFKKLKDHTFNKKYDTDRTEYEARINRIAILDYINGYRIGPIDNKTILIDQYSLCQTMKFCVEVIRSLKILENINKVLLSVGVDEGEDIFSGEDEDSVVIPSCTFRFYLMRDTEVDCISYWRMDEYIDAAIAIVINNIIDADPMYFLEKLAEKK
ncbi:MAG: hypothetical protein IPP74_00755 [Alphaproteobacteria bacterium]|nr:hypothetical protein [Alphaproteobacteria bacterium]